MKKQIRIALAGILTLALVATTAVPTLAEPTPSQIRKPDPPKPPNGGSNGNTRLKYTPIVNTYTVNGVSFSMVEVRGGTFTMGATSEQDEFRGESKPVHKVTLSAYYIGQTVVTQALWEAVMGDNPSDQQGDDLPVVNVGWYEAQNFIIKLNRMTGLKFRLLTEAEWEFAARGGTMSKGYKFSGSNNLYEVGWYDRNSNEKMQPVGTLLPNELGIYDMSGNVWEWCQDWYGKYSSKAVRNPKGPSSGVSHVYRGGCVKNYEGYCFVASRWYYDETPDAGHNLLGFRLAL